MVGRPKYKACTEIVEGERKNFSYKWIVGADSVRINVCYHTCNHLYAMSLPAKQCSLSVGLGTSSYASIVQAFNN